MKKRSRDSVIKDFYIQQAFVKEDLDYRIAKNHAETLRHIESMSNQCFWIFDYYKNGFYYISDNTHFFPQKDSDLRKKNGYDYLIRNTHPDDILYLLSIHKATWNFLQNLSQNQSITDFKVSYVIRLRSGADKYIPVSQQVKLIATDRLGNIWLSLGLFEKIGTRLNYSPYIQNMRSGIKYSLFKSTISKHSFDAPKISARELELLRYLSENYSQVEISKRMNISLDTLKTHRKNLYRKLQAESRNEVVRNAGYLGFIDF